MTIQSAKMLRANRFDRLRSLFSYNDHSNLDSDDAPLRAELFSAHQMEQHGHALAATHKLASSTAQAAPDRLLPRLAANEKILHEACALLTAALKANRRVTPAAEWLLDNFYLIEEQIRTAKRHLPEGYSRALPRLENGASAGLPRVYDIALETISHGDGQVDPQTLSQFIAAYQTKAPLALGELWAIPIMLRLALVENLRRVAARLIVGRDQRNLANDWADQMAAIAETDPKNLILVIADMARSNPPMSASFVAELARRLQGQSPALALPLTWVEQRLAELGQTIEQLVLTDAQIQAADQVSISNSIGSLRFLGLMDWREFVETLSVVEQTLHQDPADIYGKMDFVSRDRYRHAVEHLAQHSAQSECAISAQAISLARAAALEFGAEARSAHVGYYLIDAGLAQLEQAIGAHWSSWQQLCRQARGAPLAWYLGGIGLITGLLSAAALSAGLDQAAPGWLILITALCSALASSQFALALVNWASALLVAPHALPRLNFVEGIPADVRTLVAVPTLLTRIEAIDQLCEALEVRFLANRDPNLYFCLLTDFADGATEFVDGDALLLERARAGIEQLNRKYRAADADASPVAHEPFFLFHRPRRWSVGEQAWIGHERKRGKLADLNQFLRTGERVQFALIVGQLDLLAHIRYVITLDTDTQLPRDSARQFIATLAHPLNRARFDPEQRRVVEGYGILQPRVANSLPAGATSRYARLYGGEPGIDPYTRSVSDVYQDVFGEGSFIGKGIYDVEAFEQALAQQLPENRILSHDLLEGCYVRSALVSDVQLFEDYPLGYRADVSRRERWIRGDWQLLGWLFNHVRRADGQRQKNPLSALARWKIFDNLRRSLVAPALLGLLLLGWSQPTVARFWTAAVIGVLAAPALIAIVLELIRKSRDVLLRQHCSAALRSAGRHLAQALVSLILLPHEAWLNLVAIGRTLWRMTISQRHLLQWQPSSEVQRSGADGLPELLRLVWIAPLLALTCALLWLPQRQAGMTALQVALPILLAWLIAPVCAWWLSRPLGRQVAQIDAAQTRFLRQIARRTWSFFETHVGPTDHWLPPDNVQEQPLAVVAHRTSPTNIGLSLLANLAAYDFGYLPCGQLLQRCGATLATMAQLERHRGHFYNWYDTLSLRPLLPLYISSVDSGNLAGHLLTLAPGLTLLAEQPIIAPRAIDGLRDSVDLLLASAPAALRGKLAPLELALCAASQTPPANLREWIKTLRHVNLLLEQALAQESGSPEREPVADIQEQSDAAAMRDELRNEKSAFAGLDSEVQWWAGTLLRQCRQLDDELHALAPWAIYLGEANALATPLRDLLDRIPTLRELADPDFAPGLIESGDSLQATDLFAADSGLPQWHSLVKQGQQRAAERLQSITALATQAEQFAQMDYDFLYDRSSHLLAIGYNLSERRRDASYYDLLASEARLASFVAIAQRQLPQENWFALGRQLTSAGGAPVLLSWSGSMFEYLMPMLVMPSFDHTLLDATCKAAVQRQIEYGAQRQVAWGISESGYNAVDAALNYQYRAFGVPGLGLKRGLADDLVVAPYATAMALMVAPEAACANLQRLDAEGSAGRFGFYEAIDYTPARLPRGKSSALIRSFMVHHQGMSFLALAHLLLDQPMQRRFAANPLFQAAMLLLHERIPKASAFEASRSELSEIRMTAVEQQMPVRLLTSAASALPEVQLLSNGRYHVMVTNAGAGYSRWKELAVNRWREDATCDNWGAFCYVRDVDSGALWSSAYQPTLAQPKNYEVIFSEGRAEFRRRDHEIDMHTEIVVSPEDDIELRRVRLTNRSRQTRTLELTSYAEVVLAPAAADAAHPAFSNLFVQTEILAPQRAILCTRRPRSMGETPPWLLHQMAVHGVSVETSSFETDRMQFIGRGHSVASPLALSRANLNNSEGSVLDPVVAIRTRITLEPEQSATVDMVTGVTETRAASLALIEKYQDRRLADRVFDLTWTHSQVVLRQLNSTEADAQLYGRLANSIVYVNPLLRADASVLIKNRRGQSGLWGYAISGDLPIVLLQIKDAQNIDLVRQLVQAHAYWRLKGLAVDLVIWNEDHAGYRQILQEQIMGLIAAGIETNIIDRPGGIFVRPGEQISSEDRILLQSVARIILSDERGTLAEQVNRRGTPELRMPPLALPRLPLPTAAISKMPARELVLSNGIGGFTPDGREYVITTSANQVTPAPWVNVLANPHFGSVISESGGAYTWGENAHEFRLTPWHNDPVGDASGEAFYLRDEDSGRYWSPTPLPCRGDGDYVTRHGFGYSVFENLTAGLRSELCVYVALDASIKFSVLKVRNDSSTKRRLSATGYVEWVLGDLRAKSAMHVVTELDAQTGALFSKNAYNTEFAERIAFFDVDASSRTVSGDRAEFIGRNRSLRNPAALGRLRLSGKIGAGLDPCAAIQVPFELMPGQEKQIIFMLGMAGRRSADVSSLVHRFRGANAAADALRAVNQHWEQVLGAVQIETPDVSLNMLANGWLMYQTIACRLWARSGYYQSGGAFGFRDQLQDVMAMVHTQPQAARAHLLLCAAHQFVDGDVQHWWHPPSDRGVRTHCSDDYLWLPLAVCRYIETTGDRSVLDETADFLGGRAVGPDEDSYYDLPQVANAPDTLYQHCVRALRRGLRFGVHGLPLIGSCDWNDGMDKVGAEGKGESVWLAFFLYDVLLQFGPVAERHGDHVFAAECKTEAAQLRINIERDGWDGNWYRRAYFDDGTPLGSTSNPECQIDSIAQSWSVLSGAGDPQRARSGMLALDQRLVRREHALIQLLDPPFSKSDLNPGYIRGYVPGVRENGGQYTHAAIWAAMAFAKLGDSRRAWELLGMINPINHGRTPEEIAVYKVEPYVVAADVYGVAPHIGRGGWTWYTGSAGWMYRLIVESLLGLRRSGERLYFAPCLPDAWRSFRLRYRFGGSTYQIVVVQTRVVDGTTVVTIDGVERATDFIELHDDYREHQVEIRVPAMLADAQMTDNASLEKP